MSNIDKQALRENFEEWAEEMCALPWGYLKKRRTSDGYYSGQTYTSLWAAWCGCHAYMLDELEAAEKRVAELEAREPDLYLCRVTRDGEDLYSPCGRDYPRGRGYIAAGIRINGEG